MTILDERPRTADRAEFAEFTEFVTCYGRYDIDVLVEDPISHVQTWRPFSTGARPLTFADQATADRFAHRLAEQEPNHWIDSEGRQLPAAALAYRIIVEVTRTIIERDYFADAPVPAKFTSYKRIDLHRG